MVSLKQEVNVADYFGAVTVFCLFFVIIFVISVTCVLWFCIDKNDEATVIDKWRGIRKESQAYPKSKPLLAQGSNY
ncbi:hypothetical protein M514_01070 [Trichuris suis]|uniref:Uncharacterized protein n=1 Tax=Trichuris suis TaxID=68888 RepID=A0A085MXD4_9BILA|nr:hypothetical protein M513_01070 [Trichuris suis]KFD61880.1 hypothetical protein M514_01070 [Trichuris suis]KHJ45719.1 hypothetical protein D918_03931 [Trichuris suis]